MRTVILLLLLTGCALTRGPTLASGCTASLPDQKVVCYCSEAGSISDNITLP